MEAFLLSLSKSAVISMEVTNAIAWAVRPS